MKILIISSQYYDHNDNTLDIASMRADWSDEVNHAYDNADVVLLQFSPCMQVLKAPPGVHAVLAQKDVGDGVHVLTQLAAAGLVSNRSDL